MICSLKWHLFVLSQEVSFQQSRINTNFLQHFSHNGENQKTKKQKTKKKKEERQGQPGAWGSRLFGNRGLDVRNLPTQIEMLFPQFKLMTLGCNREILPLHQDHPLSQRKKAFQGNNKFCLQLILLLERICFQPSFWLSAIMHHNRWFASSYSRFSNR